MPYVFWVSLKDRAKRTKVCVKWELVIIHVFFPHKNSYPKSDMLSLRGTASLKVLPFTQKQ